MLSYLKKMYDYIVIDNPPIGIVTDGMQCMLLADYPIYIFKANHSKRIFVENVERLINENGITKLAIVLNAVDSEYSGVAYTKSSLIILMDMDMDMHTLMVMAMVIMMRII